ncbi:MAG TPA: hypothetical protein VGF98_11880 [Candidatus Tumulicola sp.]|jgi:hypothetical protein
MKSLAFLAGTMAVLCTFATAAANAQSPYAATPAPSAAPVAAQLDPALVAQFSTFFSDVIAGRPPTGNITPVMQAAMTPAALMPVQQYFSSLGTFARLQFVSHDTAGNFERYHFLATFSNGSQKVMFVTDRSGALAGFFNE